MEDYCLIIKMVSANERTLTDSYDILGIEYKGFYILEEWKLRYEILKRIYKTMEMDKKVRRMI